MRIAIMGEGQVGKALAAALERSGHAVVFGSREPRGVHAKSVAEASTESELVVLAVPFEAVNDVVATAGGFNGKIVVDATNPLGMGPDGLGLTIGFATSGAERLAAAAPGAKIFKAFNQTGFENMAHAEGYAARPVMFVAGDDAAAKPRVLQMVADAGFEAVDLGGLTKARLLEPLAMLWIELARKRGLGPDFSFSLQRRSPSA